MNIVDLGDDQLKLSGQAVLVGLENNPFNPRFNPAGIQLLPSLLYHQLYPNPTFPSPSPTAVNVARETLSKNGLFSRQVKPHQQVELPLPPLLGQNIVEHFERLGNQVAQHHLDQAESFATESIAPYALALLPTVPGWSKFDPTTQTWEPVPYPAEDTLSMDAEVLHNIHPYPVMACAASSAGWYAWLSPWLLEQSIKTNHFIPLGPRRQPKLIVGRNTGYLRASIQEEYHLEASQTRFIDVQNLHTAFQSLPQSSRHRTVVEDKETGEVYGPPSLTRRFQVERKIEKYEALLEKGVEEVEVEKEVEVKDVEEEKRMPLPIVFESWQQTSKTERVMVVVKTKDFIQGLKKTLLGFPLPATSSTKSSTGLDGISGNSQVTSLRKLYELYYPKEPLQFSWNDSFDVKDRSEVRKRLDYLFLDLSVDVLAIQKVFKSSFPRFRLLCPSPVSFAGLLTMGTPILPVDKTWDQYLLQADEVFNNVNGNATTEIALLAERARALWTPARLSQNATCPAELASDPYWSQLDWTPRPARHFDWPTEFQSAISPPIPPSSPLLSLARSPPSPPFKKFAPSPAEPQGSLPLTYPALSKSQDIPVQIGLKYKSHPVVFSNEHGWVFRTTTPIEGLEALTFLPDPSDSALSEDTKTSSATFYQMPRFDKTAKSVRSVLGKAYLSESVFKHLTCADADLLLLIRKKADYELVKQAIGRALQRNDYDAKAPVGENASTDTTSDTIVPEPPIESTTPSQSLPLEPSNRFEYLSPSESALQATWWPKWYHDLFGYRSQQTPANMMNLTIKTQITALLLRLTWLGYPVYRTKEHGWVYRVPTQEATIIDPRYTTRLRFHEGRIASNSLKPSAHLARTDIIPYKLSQTKRYAFFKVPHPDGNHAKVGTMITKSSLKYFVDGTLASVYPAAKDIINASIMCSSWTLFRDRVYRQWAVRESEDVDMGYGTGVEGENEGRWGLILPRISPMGTMTRRATDDLWLTAVNCKRDMIGTELKSMIKAPPGYRIVGADVDSQEYWVANTCGDAQLGIHGGTPVSWMGLEGDKSKGTDIHSTTASLVNMVEKGSSQSVSWDREISKTLNYSRIYGAGVKHAANILLQAMPVPDSSLAAETASVLYDNTKGQRSSHPKLHSFWFGGSESYLFNSLEQVARNERPTTPALKATISPGLQEEFLDRVGEHMPTRVNWAVQSSGVDYLHLLMTSMDYLCSTYDIGARYMLSVHDEVRYLVKEEDAYRAALALQISNLWTRTLFAYQLGLEDLPQSCAFFSSVEIDTVLRKDVTSDCVTPSNKIPVPPGESVDIHAILTKTGGSLLRNGPSPSPVPASSEATTAAFATLLEDWKTLYPQPTDLGSSPASSDLQPFSFEKLDAAWRNFYLRAQAANDEDEIVRLYEEAGRPVDPIKAIYDNREDQLEFQEQMGRPDERRMLKAVDDDMF